MMVGSDLLWLMMVGLDGLNPMVDWMIYNDG